VASRGFAVTIFHGSEMGSRHIFISLLPAITNDHFLIFNPMLPSTMISLLATYHTISREEILECYPRHTVVSNPTMTSS
jgi:hypothetical protein